jgi:hypothetical protein
MTFFGHSLGTHIDHSHFFYSLSQKSGNSNNLHPFFHIDQLQQKWFKNIDARMNHIFAKLLQKG